MAEQVFSGVALEGETVAENVELAREAEALGYRSAWFSEIAGPDAVSVLAACSLATTSLTLGSAIVPVQVRDPFLTAMTAVGLGEVSNGRVVLGVGVSTAAIVEQWHSLPWSASRALLADHINITKRLMRGEKVSSTGRFTLSNAGLTVRKPVATPIYVGAVNEGMIRVAAETADGLLLIYPSLSYMARVNEQVSEALSRRQRSRRDFKVVAMVLAALDDEAEALAAQVLAQYARFPPYRRAFTLDGWGDDCEAIARGWAAGGRTEAVRAVRREMVAAHVLVGGAADCRRRAAELLELGADEVVVAAPRPLGTRGSGPARGIRHVMRALSS